MTPYEIEILLKFYYSPSPELEDAPILAETLTNFERLGLIEQVGSDQSAYFKGTARLSAYCEALQLMRLPVLEKKWVIP